jgi:hypothetical protein
MSKKDLMAAFTVRPPDGWHSGVYLLYAAGEDVDYARLQIEAQKVPSFPLGHGCYLVQLEGALFQEFSDAASSALPMEDGKAELVLVHLAHSTMIHNTSGGLGLIEWLKAHGRFPGSHLLK